jgi:hypothetical protein
LSGRIRRAESTTARAALSNVSNWPNATRRRPDGMGRFNFL